MDKNHFYIQYYIMLLRQKIDDKQLLKQLQGSGFFMDLLLPPHFPGSKPDEGSTSYPGEKHAVFVKKEDGKRKLIKGNFIGPGTHIEKRMNDKPVDGPGGLDSAAKKHDISYSKANNRLKSGQTTKKEFINEIHNADDEFIEDTRKIEGRPISTNIARKMIQLKKLGETIGVLPTSIFSGSGEIDIDSDAFKEMKLKVLPADIELRKSVKKLKGGLAPLAVALLSSLGGVAIQKIADFIGDKIKGKGLLYGSGEIKDARKNIAAKLDTLPEKDQINAIHKTIKSLGIKAFDLPE